MEGAGIRGLLACVVLFLVVSLVAPQLGPAPTSAARDRTSATPAFPATDSGARALPGAGPVPVPVVVLPVGSDLADLEVDPIRTRAYVADRTNNRVLVLGLNNDTIYRAIPVRAEPVALAINPSADTLYVGHAGNQSIQAIDLTTLSVVRTIDTTFLTWDLVAPTDRSLVATTHDDQWTGQFPYVLDARNGNVLQRLCWGPISCNPFYQDTMAVLDADRDWLYLAESALQIPILLVSYHRNPGSDAWSLVNDSRANDWGATGGEARDLAVTPDNRFLYVASNYSTVVQLNASDLRFERRIGYGFHSYSVALASAGVPIAMAISDNSPESRLAIQVYDASGDFLANIPVPAPVRRVRPISDGLRFVATVGTGLQDVAIVNSTTIARGSPFDYVNTTRPPLSSQVVSFVPLTEINATMAVDGVRIVVGAFDNITGRIWGEVSDPLAEGKHTLLVRAERSGLELASLSRDFWVDLTAPVFQLDPVPALTPYAYVTISGHVIDLKLRAAVNVSGRWALLDASGRFSIQIELQPGDTTILIWTWDEAGNYAETWVTIEFRPPEEWYANPAKHFRIRVPYRWAATGNLTVNGEPVDVLLESTTDVSANVGVVSENRTLNGTYAEARSILQEAIDNLSSLAGFQVLEPVTTRLVDNHPAALVYVTWQPSTYNINQVLVVVVGAEWGMFWAIAGTMFSWDASVVRPIVNATIDSFDISANPDWPPPPPSGGNTTATPSGFPWLLLGGAVAAGLMVAAVAFVLLRRRPPRT